VGRHRRTAVLRRGLAASTLTRTLRLVTRPRFALAIAVVACALPTLASGALSAPAANSVTFQDSTGENPAAADISAVTVSNNDTGLLKFKIDIPNRPTAPQDMFVLIWVDSDNNPQTGDPDSLGADYVILWFRGDIALLQWDGVEMGGNPPATSLIFAYQNGITISISAAELGNTKKFGFATRAVSGVVIDPVTGDVDFTNVVADDAPGGAGFYPYEVKITPATLVAKSLKASPAKPKAGKPFTLRLVAARSDTGATIQNGRVTCVGKAGNKRVKAQVARVVAGAATCTWNIPAAAAGKAFRGTVTVSFEGLSTSKGYASKIAR
jgi:hypothetical protein